MGTNKESCAVKAQLLISFFLLCYLVFVAYYSTFDKTHGGHEHTSSFQHNVLLSFIIVSCLLELYSVIINKSLQSKYWE